MGKSVPTNLVQRLANPSQTVSELAPSFSISQFRPFNVNSLQLNICQHSPIITRSERLLARLKRKRFNLSGSDNQLNGSNFLDTSTLVGQKIYIKYIFLDI
jgi:hypothetical protein